MDLSTEISFVTELPSSTMEMMNNTDVPEEELLPFITYSSITELVISSIYLVATTVSYH
jgi:hypothetical protein